MPLPGNIKEEMIEYLQEWTRGADGKPLKRVDASEIIDNLMDLVKEML